LRRDKISPFLR